MGTSVSKEHEPSGVTLWCKEALVCNLKNDRGPYAIYRFECQYREFRWFVCKRFSEVRALHSRVGYKVPGLKAPKTRWHHNLNNFVVDSRKAELAEYLQKLVQWKDIWENQAIQLFFEVGAVSFDRRFGDKGKEGFLKKKSGGRKYLNSGMFVTWKVRWVVIRDGFLAYYYDNNATEPLEVMLMDSKFSLECDRTEQTITVQNSSRRLVLKVEGSRRLLDEWMTSLTWYTHVRYERLSHAKNLHSSLEVPSSYTVCRPLCRANYYVDGKETMAAIYHEILNAKETIYITGWFLSPDIIVSPDYRGGPVDNDAGEMDVLTAFMTDETVGNAVGEGIEEDDGWCVLANVPTNVTLPITLADLLKFKASKGVKIFIMLYREVQLALDLNSQNTAKRLEKLHENIRVLRHSSTLMSNLPWSHHEKSVCIDHRVAFIGGIDLCIGRYDTSDHPIFDPALNISSRSAVFPGKDYYNPCVAVAKNHELDDHYADLLARDVHPRMPWHDVSVALYNEAAVDVELHFVQRWNHNIMDLNAKNPTMLLPHTDNQMWFTENMVPRDGDVDSFFASNGIPLAANGGTCSVQIVRSVGPWSAGTATESSVAAAYTSVILASEHFVYIENQFFISKTAGKGVKNAIAEAIYIRVKKAILDKTSYRVCIVLPIHPEGDPCSATVQTLMRHTYRTISRGNGALLRRLKSEFPDVNITDYISFCSLRGWGTRLVNGVREPVTEMIYVHSKLLIADERVVIVGSANINDRSMMGDRDSEIAAVISDRKVVNIQMNGQPYEAGVFAHSLRMKLWREHLGVEAGSEEDKMMADPLSHWTHRELWMRTSLQNTQIYTEVFGSMIEERLHKISDANVHLSKRRGIEMDPGREGVNVVAASNSSDTEDVESQMGDPGRRNEFMEVMDEAGNIVTCPMNEPLSANKSPQKIRRDKEAAEEGDDSQPESSEEKRPNSTGSLKNWETALSRVRGHLVVFPFNFLSEENLFPKLLTVEGVLPRSMFQ